MRFLGFIWKRVENERELKMRERREMREKKDIILIYIILFCKYIILMSKRGK